MSRSARGAFRRWVLDATNGVELQGCASGGVFEAGHCPTTRTASASAKARREPRSRARGRVSNPERAAPNHLARSNPILSRRRG